MKLAKWWGHFQRENTLFSPQTETPHWNACIFFITYPDSFFLRKKLLSLDAKCWSFPLTFCAETRYRELETFRASALSGLNWQWLTSSFQWSPLYPSHRYPKGFLPPCNHSWTLKMLSTVGTAIWRSFSFLLFTCNCLLHSQSNAKKNGGKSRNESSCKKKRKKRKPFQFG